MERLQPDKLTRRNLWCFATGTIGRDMGGCLWTNFLLTFVLFTKSLTTAQFAALSVIMVLARIFDAVNDPIMGNILEITRTKWGKFKPWIAIGAVLTVVIFILSFSNTLQGWTYVAVFGILYFAYSIVFTMNDIAYWGMLPSLAQRAADRNLLSSMTIFCAGIGQFFSNTLIPALTAGERVVGGNAITAYRLMSVIVSVAFLISSLVTLLGVREKPLPPVREGDIRRVSFREVFKTFKNNDQISWSAVIFLLCSVSNLLMNSGLAMTYVYFRYGYNGALMSVFGLAGNVTAVFLMVSFAALSKRFSRQTLMRAGTLIALLGYAVMLASGTLLGNAGMLGFGVLTGGYVFVFVGQTLVYMLMLICIANTVEYNEWKTGRRDEGILFAVRPFITKLSGALAQFTVMLVYLAVGVRSFTNQISDLENQASAGSITLEDKTAAITGVLAGVSGGQSVALLLCMTLLTSVLLIGSWLLFRKKYTISEERYDQMLVDIAARQTQGEES